MRPLFAWLMMGAEALFESVVVGGDMDQLQVHSACAAAVRRRLNACFEARQVNPPMYAARGMVSACHLLHILAARRLDEGRAGALIVAALDSFHAGELLTSEQAEDAQEWGAYAVYCHRLSELAEALQESVRAGGVVLRSGETRVPLKAKGLNPWIDANLHIDSLLERMTPDCADWSSAAGCWPDLQVVPPGGLLLADAEAWATSAGVADPGELTGLLELATSAETPRGEGADVVRLEVLGEPVKGGACTGDKSLSDEDVLLRYEAICRELGTTHGANKQLSEETGLSERECLRRRRRAEEARSAALEPIGAMAAALGAGKRA